MPYNPFTRDIYRAATQHIPSESLEDGLYDILKYASGGGGMICSKLHAGAVGDGKALSDVSFSSANTLAPFDLMSSNTASFKAADVGKVGWVRGAGTGGAAVFFEIVEFISAQRVRIADGVPQNGSSAYYVEYGTDDTAALSLGDSMARAAGLPFWIEPGLYMANLNMDRGAENPKFYWFGHSGSTRISSARDVGYAAQFVASNYCTDYIISGLEFTYAHGFTTAVQRGSALRIGRHDYGLLENIRAQGGLVAFEHFGSFGNRLRRLRVGNSNTGYGYLGYGVPDAYCGWNSFEHPVFKGRKVGYLVDNSVTPANEAGEGNHILHGDWEAMSTALAYYVRKHGASHKMEELVNCWFEGNLYAGSVDMSDLTMLPRSIGTVNFQRQIYITGAVANPAVPQYEYPSMVRLRNTQFAPHVIGSYVEIDQLSSGGEPVYESGASPQGGITIKRAVAEYHNPSNFSGVIINHQVQEIWAKRSTNSDGTLLARAPQHKSQLDYSTKNYLAAPSPSPLQTVTLSGGATAELVAEGPGQGLSLELSIPQGGNVALNGAAYSNWYGDSSDPADVQGSFAYLSFAIRALVAGTMLDMRANSTGNGMENGLTLEDTGWKTYHGVRRNTAFNFNLFNPNASTATVRISNLQVCLFPSYRGLLEYQRSNRLAAVGRDGITRLFKTVSTSELAALVTTADFGTPPLDPNTGEPLLTVPIGQRNNGNFEIWTDAATPSSWNKGDPAINGSYTISVAREDVDTVSGVACRLTLGNTDPNGDGNANSRTQENWFSNNQLTVGNRYRLQGWFKWISSPVGDPSHLVIGTAYGQSIQVLRSDDPNKAGWQWKAVEFTCTGYNGSGKFFFCGDGGAGHDVYLLDSIQVIDITKL